jgi:hypothetical protein
MREPGNLIKQKSQHSRTPPWSGGSASQIRPNTCGTNRESRNPIEVAYTHALEKSRSNPKTQRRARAAQGEGRGLRWGGDGRYLDVDVLGGLLLLAEDLAPGGAEPALHEPCRHPGRHHWKTMTSRARRRFALPGSFALSPNQRRRRKAQMC